jgi:uncharacterized protein
MGMGVLRDLVLQRPDLWLAVGGFLIGTIFGAIVFRTNFCTMGSLSDIVSFGDFRRFRSWILAAATALAGVQVLRVTGSVPIEKTMYLAPTLNWFGNVAGGLMFGFGMVFAGGCASKNLARVGGGDLRSLMTLIVMGLFAYMSIGGILGPIRSRLEQWTSIDLKSWKLATQSLAEMVEATLHLAPHVASLLVSAVLMAGALYYCFKDEGFRSSRVHVLAGIGIGLCAVAGWVLTGLAFDDLAEKPVMPISLTYVRPTADTIEWLQRFTAGMTPGFGVTTVLGAVFGSFLTSMAMGRFQFSTFSNVADTKRSLFGAMLMGIGGVMALGCTVGQCITGVSTLALGSFLTFAAIVAGGLQGMKTLEKILMNEV